MNQHHPVDDEDYERRYAIREGARNHASEEYFTARPQIDSNDRRKVFESGFDRGYAARPAVAVATRDDAYGDIAFGWHFAGITLEEGDKRLMAMLVKAFGSDHPAIDDMTALLFRARARPAAEPAAIKDRLLAALERAAVAESEVRRLTDERSVEPAAPEPVAQEPLGYMSPQDAEYLRSRIVQYRGRNYNIKSTIFLDSGLGATVPLYTRPEVAQDKERLDWIASQDSDYFEFGIVRCGPQDGDFFILIGRDSFHGKTFREAIDRAIRGETGGGES